MPRVALSVIVCLLCEVAPAGSAAAAPAPLAAELAASRAEAVRTAAAGQRLYQEESYAEALEKFRRAYVLYPSPDLLVYIAACLVSLHLEIEGVRVLLDFFVDPGQSKQELRDLALRLWQQAPAAAREGLLLAGANRLPGAVRKKLDHLPAWHRDQLPAELRRLLVEVQVITTPTDIDLWVNDLAAPAGDRLYLTPGRHRLRAVPRRAGYLPAEVVINVGVDLAKVVLRLPLRLQVRSPQGREVRVDDQPVPAAPDEGLWQQSLVPVSPGPHQVVVVSPRGRRTARLIDVAEGAPAEVVIGPLPLWPGLALAGAGVASLITGAVLLSINGSCATPGDITVCDRVYQTSGGGYAAVAVGAAAVAVGAAWFAYSSIDHPFFHRPSGRRVAIAPAPGVGGATLLLSGSY